MTKAKKIALVLALVLIVPAFMWSQFSFYNVSARAADAGAIQDDISNVQDKLAKEQKAKEKLLQNLGQINSAVATANSVINKTKSEIQTTVKTISQKEQEINNLNDKITLQQEMLRSFLQQIYYAKSQPVLNVVLAEGNFSDIFSSNDHLMTLEDKIVAIVNDIAEAKIQVEGDKVQLAEQKAQHEEVLGNKLDEKQGLVADQVDTQQSIADKQKTIDKLNKELLQLQGDLNTLLGKSYSAKNIMDAVSFASDETGVPKGFLIGVLKMETNLGANVGGCTYGQVESGAEASYKAGKLGKTAWATFLRRRDTFKSITKELGIDYQKQKVSCNPKGYTGTGGAMGVAQFMPDTWVAYKTQVTSKTGHNPPSPWDLTDGVMAMALKLGRVPGVTAGKTSAFKTAACAYLGTCYAPYINGILYWADNYKSLIN